MRGRIFCSVVLAENSSLLWDLRQKEFLWILLRISSQNKN